MLTTYTHDYLPPNIERYNFTKLSTLGPKSGFKTKNESTQLPVIAASCGENEWTGIAPMGILIKPRLIPDEPKDTRKINSCFSDKPNKFLESLCIKYPELYERIMSTPKDDLYRQIDSDRFRSTYQVDYDHISEFPHGVYDGLTTKNNQEIEDFNSKDPCAIYRGNPKIVKQIDPVDPCLGLYRPVRVETITKIPKNYTSSSHWTDGATKMKGPNVSEYTDGISKIGGIIQKENLNDHSKCKSGKSCIHEFLLK